MNNKETSFFQRVLNAFNRFFKGKKIVVLGSKATGKTTLQTFLREGRVVTKYEETLVENLPANTYYGTDFKFHLKKGKDIGGSDTYKSYWEKLIKGSDYCFYLFNTYDIYANNKRAILYMSDYLPHIAKICNDNNVKLLVVGNFTDKITNFSMEQKEISHKIYPNMVNSFMDAKLDISNVIYGNMTENGIEKMINEIIAQIKLSNL